MRGLWVFLALLLCIGTAPAQAGSTDAFVEISIPERTLRVQLPDGTIKQYQVAVPRKTPSRSTEGVITKIERNPWWRPTPATRRYYLAKYGEALPAEIPPGDPLNAMGEWKFHLKFTTKGANAAIRLHGTNRPEQIGMQISRGCIRLHNESAAELAQDLAGLSTRFIISIRSHALPSPAS